MVKLYGIPNCDKVKKAISGLKSSEIEFEMVNFKKHKPTQTEINRWKKHCKDWPVNKRGTTYRKVKETFENSSDESKMQLIIENPSLIKRPIIEREKNVLMVGYDDALMSKIQSQCLEKYIYW